MVIRERRDETPYTFEFMLKWRNDILVIFDSISLDNTDHKRVTEKLMVPLWFEIVFLNTDTTIRFISFPKHIVYIMALVLSGR